MEISEAKMDVADCFAPRRRSRHSKPHGYVETTKDVDKMRSRASFMIAVLFSTGDDRKGCPNYPVVKDTIISRLEQRYSLMLCR